MVGQWAQVVAEPIRLWRTWSAWLAQEAEGWLVYLDHGPSKDIRCDVLMQTGRLRPSAQDNLREAITTRNELHADTGRLFFMAAHYLAVSSKLGPKSNFNNVPGPPLNLRASDYTQSPNSLGGAACVLVPSQKTQKIKTNQPRQCKC